MGDVGERRRREKYTQGEGEKVTLVSLFLHRAHAHTPQVPAMQASLWLGLSHFDPKITCSASHSSIFASGKQTYSALYVALTRTTCSNTHDSCC